MQIAKTPLKTHISHALKICKHEFLMSRILLIIVCIIMAINLLIFINNDRHSATFYILIVIQWFAFFICSITYVLSAAISFYQGVFGKHAYLTHALPVSIESIIGAKILIYFLWFLVIFAAFIFALYAGTSGISQVGDLLALFQDALVWKIIPFFILSVLQEIVFIFMVVALVHRKKTYTLFIGILTYFGIKVLLLILFGILSNLMPDNIEENTILLLLYLYNILLLCLFYFICHRIIKYKLAL
ncbi:hypothetical protein [Helicobacter bilis]|uniref:Uncharacterized protein n=1 Tax=Helicobacter bilis TaxID=37372 RepID=A0A4U8UAD0_9HELI|nr:hypothetical protein [Helicobacter bilis]TLE11101.1 hypothetical protein LS79_003870 [Helicobacter bilis]